MKIRIQSLVFCALISVACSKKADQPSATTGAAAIADNKEEATKKIDGRCDNETADNTAGSYYFYPENREMFITMNGFAIRIPIDVAGAASADNKVSLTYKWVDDEKVTTGSGTVGWIGTQKWSLNFDTIKDSVCHPVTDDLFYKKLPELGLSANKYLDAANNDIMTIIADSQKLISEEKGKTIIFFYRVRSKSDDAGITIYASMNAPSPDTSSVWPAMTLTPLGGDLVIKYNEKLTRKYTLVK